MDVAVIQTTAVYMTCIISTASTGLTTLCFATVDHPSPCCALAEIIIPSKIYSNHNKFRTLYT